MDGAWMNGYMDGHVNRYMDGSMDGEREKRMNKWVVGRWMDRFDICWAPTRFQALP